MKSLKFLIPVLALGFLASATLSNAQEKKGRGGMSPEARLEQLDKELTLTADQKTKITAILEKARDEMQAVPKEERKEKMPDMMKAQNAKIRAVLTAEQQAKFDAMPQGGQGKKNK
jgi:Spy/CpxP family protein refolding chaperone